MRTIPKRVKTFGIEQGMTLVDYSCGPGRYTIEFVELMERMGKSTVDIHEMATRMDKIVRGEFY